MEDGSAVAGPSSLLLDPDHAPSFSSSTPLPPPSLPSLPPELLDRVLLACSPGDLGALALTCKALNTYLRSASRLWRTLYCQRWDVLVQSTSPQHDPLLTQACPHTRFLRRAKRAHSRDVAKGNVESHPQQCATAGLPTSSIYLFGAPAPSPKSATTTNGVESKRLYLEERVHGPARSFDFREQVQRRTWAEKRIKALGSRSIELMANYNDTLQTLLSVARSRSPRSGEPQLHYDMMSADRLHHLLSAGRGDAFHQLIFPRPDVIKLREWQFQQLRKDLSEQASLSGRASRRDDKRQRSFSSSSGADAKRPKKAVASLSDDSPQRTRRRSARLMLNAYPSELHHLLRDDKGNLLTHADDSGEAFRLEELELLDEQLAAELHVLHGILPSNEVHQKRPTLDRSNSASGSIDAEDRMSSTSESRHNEIRSESPEPEGELRDGADLQTDESDEDGDEDEDEARAMRARGFGHHRHHDPPLASDAGREGDLRLRGRAREIVYDTARYGPENSFGPLRPWRERIEYLDGARDELDPEGEEAEVEEDDEDNSTEQGDEAVDSRRSSNGDDLVEDDASLEQGGGITDALPEETTQLAEDRAAASPPSTARGGGSASPPPAFGDDDPPVIELIGNANILDHDFGDDDDDFDPDDDDDGMMGMDNLLFEVREAAISLSRGVNPWHESRRLKNALDNYDLPIPSTRAAITTAPDRSPQKVWRTEKRVDWIVLEAVMIVMYCNIQHAVVDHGWGRTFRLPGRKRSLTGRDAHARQIHGARPSHRSQSWSLWRDLLGLPCGWEHSRAHHPLQQVGSSLHLKPFDWAGVESTWIGTYAFLDWSKWASYNARDPIARGYPQDAEQGVDPTHPPSGESGRQVVNLKNEREAVGDCLQLRMELLPLDQQHATTDTDRIMSQLEMDSAPQWDEHGNLPPGHYPPLRFRGRTVTFLDDSPPMLRGEVHGIVRPIYATASSDYDAKRDGQRAVVALHWDLTHRYEGQDRWSLSGVQPGPPGSHAPIYGIWGSSERRDNTSPCGPFAYYKVDERPWKEVEALLAEEDRTTRAI